MEFLLFGGFWFWVCIGAVIIAAAIPLMDDSWIGSNAVVVVGALAIWYFSGFYQPWHWLGANWPFLLLCGVAYFCGGIVWGYLNWRFCFLHDQGDEYEKWRSQYQMNYADYANKPSTNPKWTPDTYKVWLKKWYAYPPSAADNKTRFFIWIVYWPFNLPFVLLNNPVRRIFNAIWRQMVGFYEKAAQTVFANRFEELR